MSGREKFVDATTHFLPDLLRGKSQNVGSSKADRVGNALINTVGVNGLGALPAALMGEIGGLTFDEVFHIPHIDFQHFHALGNSAGDIAILVGAGLAVVAFESWELGTSAWAGRTERRTGVKPFGKTK